MEVVFSMSRLIWSPMQGRIKVDLEANGKNLADLLITDHFPFRCGVENLKKRKSLAAQRKSKQFCPKTLKASWRFNCSPHKSSCCQADTKCSSYTKQLRINGKLKTVADPEAYMIDLQFSAGLKMTPNITYFVEYFPSKPEQTVMTSYCLSNVVNEFFYSSTSGTVGRKVFVCQKL